MVFTNAPPPSHLCILLGFDTKPTLLWSPLPMQRGDVRGFCNYVLALSPELR